MLKVLVKVLVTSETQILTSRTLKSHKIKSTFYTESTLCKLLCKPKDRIATEYKNTIVYEIDCSNWTAVYFSESKCS